MEPKTLLSFIQTLALRAGRYLLKHRVQVKIAAYKDRQDIVTNVDLAAEQLLIRSIRNRFPNHGIVSEEAGQLRQASPYLWIIDPLDGTKEYYRGLPQFSTCFCLQKNQRTIAAVVYRPVSAELYSAARGLGAFLGSKPIAVNHQANLADSIIYSYLPNNQLHGPRRRRVWRQLEQLSLHSYRIRGASEENAAMCWVASGKIEASLNLQNQPKWHDMVQGMFIARQAGARVSDLAGRPLIRHHAARGLLVSNGRVHRQLLQTIADAAN